MARISTTDPQDELFDVVDEAGNPTGVEKPRGLIHRDGDWHRSLHIWVYGIGDDGQPFVLFQRRSPTKDTSPGALDVAVGGHIRAGEDIAETVREAEEELGLSVESSELTFLGRRSGVYRGEGVVDREINEVYAVRSDLDPGCYRLHPVELESLVFVSLVDSASLFRGERSKVRAVEYWPDQHTATATSHRIDISMHDFAGGIGDRYGLAVTASIADLLDARTLNHFLIQ